MIQVLQVKGGVLHSLHQSFTALHCRFCSMHLLTQVLGNTGDGRQYSTQHRTITASSIWQPPYIPLPPLNLATQQKWFIIACTVAWVSTPRYFGGWKRGLYETRNLGLNWASKKEPVYFLCLIGYVLFISEIQSWSQVWWHMSLISALERQKQGDLCEFKVRLVYKLSSLLLSYK